MWPHHSRSGLVMAVKLGSEATHAETHDAPCAGQALGIARLGEGVHPILLIDGELVGVKETKSRVHVEDLGGNSDRLIELDVDLRVATLSEMAVAREGAVCQRVQCVALPTIALHAFAGKPATLR